jgi:hypothetical protein
LSETTTFNRDYDKESVSSEKKLTYLQSATLQLLSRVEYKSSRGSLFSEVTSINMTPEKWSVSLDGTERYSETNTLTPLSSSEYMDVTDVKSTIISKLTTVEASYTSEQYFSSPRNGLKNSESIVTGQSSYEITDTLAEDVSEGELYSQTNELAIGSTMNVLKNSESSPSSSSESSYELSTPSAEDISEATSFLLDTVSNRMSSYSDYDGHSTHNKLLNKSTIWAR